jgi:hypothetical protein
MDGGRTLRTRTDSSVFSGVIFSTAVAFMTCSFANPELADSDAASECWTTQILSMKRRQ